MTMFHRNNEPGQVCDGCRYWSEMIAQSNGSGIQAYCLCRESPRYATYTVKRDSCDAWRDGSWGAVDQPGGDPYTGDMT
jgi:hypothetical protein